VNVLVVVDYQGDWRCTIPGAQVVSAPGYLGDSCPTTIHSAQVLNLCSCERYQGEGYYVSLLAEARAHKCLPVMSAVGGLQGGSLARVLDETLRPLYPDLAIGNASSIRIDGYFGLDPAQRFGSIAQRAFEATGLPLLSLTLQRTPRGWSLQRARALGAADVPDDQLPAMWQAAAAYISTQPAATAAARRTSPALAILYDSDEPEPPSNAASLAKFRRVAGELGMHSDFIGRNDIGRLSEFDGLFIRDTTRVTHYTYDFARRAAAAGLVVIDDPDSILKCTNKVYLHALFTRHGVPVPKTLLVHEHNIGDIVPTLGLPCVLKQPDSAFSLGVAKIESAEAVERCARTLLRKSHLIVAQEWLPTAFDWRVGVLDRRPLYVCKYFMAPGHWQVVKRDADRKLEGLTATLAVDDAPQEVIDVAVRAANLIGDGLYGVDVKELNGQCYVMEVNDNPNLDAGNEDGVLKDALYREVLGVFLRRIRTRQAAAAS
jgi:glutathione synthase/RimK-type ligase-like ATP-grasp enzyme